MDNFVWFRKRRFFLQPIREKLAKMFFVKFIFLNYCSERISNSIITKIFKKNSNCQFVSMYFEVSADETRSDVGGLFDNHHSTHLKHYPFEQKLLTHFSNSTYCGIWIWICDHSLIPANFPSGNFSESHHVRLTHFHKYFVIFIRWGFFRHFVLNW